jgi:Na+/H+-dicarboxylate symporter
MQTQRQFIFLISAILLGILFGLLDNPYVLQGAKLLSEVFIRILKTISLPIISLSLIATISGLEKEISLRLGRKVVQYTILTTVISAAISWGLYDLIKPVQTTAQATGTLANQNLNTSYLDEVLKVIPNNVLQPFLEGNVVGIVLLSIVLGVAILQLPQKPRDHLHQTMSGLFLAVLQITRWVVKLMPIPVFAFVVIFVKDLSQNLQLEQLGYYLLVLLLANFVQASIILPALLKTHKLNPLKSLRGMFPAITLAFFSKSSAASLPSAIQSSEENLRVDPKISRFCFPLCTTINMNACASFMMITVLFVSESNGLTFSMLDKCLWVGIVTLAAIGNAGVPMGCFFLASALLTTLNVPLALMGLILPFYSLLDMLESATNIWSDSCVTLVVDKWWKSAQPEIKLAATPLSDS